jgi:hypothetical protein
MERSKKTLPPITKVDFNPTQGGEFPKTFSFQKIF